MSPTTPGITPCTHRNGAQFKEVPPPEELLTRRDIEVLTLIATGHISKEIGTKLNISIKTAQAHRSSIQKKLRAYLGGTSTQLLTHYAIAAKLVKNRFTVKRSRNGHDHLNFGRGGNGDEKNGHHFAFRARK